MDFSYKPSQSILSRVLYPIQNLADSASSGSPSPGSDIWSFPMLALEENEQVLTKDNFKKYFSVALSKSDQTLCECQGGSSGTFKRKLLVNFPGEVYWESCFWREM